VLTVVTALALVSGAAYGQTAPSIDPEARRAAQQL
jgi:hypothetical protein